MTTLQLVLVLLASAVLVVALFRALNLPPVLGYLLVGAAIGPRALDLIPDSDAARHLAEFGVVFLMFSIGLEFSLPRLYSMKRTVFGLGLAQVLLTILATVAAAMLAGLTLQAGIALGGILAMSSTALVVKMLSERMQMESKHGREIIGVLQLINAQNDEGQITPFSSDDVLEALVMLACAALDGYIREEKLRQEIAQLRIEIDESRRAKQVAEITDTQYFKRLQDQARAMREKKP